MFDSSTITSELFLSYDFVIELFCLVLASATVFVSLYHFSHIRTKWTSCSIWQYGKVWRKKCRINYNEQWLKNYIKPKPRRLSTQENKNMNSSKIISSISPCYFFLVTNIYMFLFRLELIQHNLQNCQNFRGIQHHVHQFLKSFVKFNFELLLN